MRMAIVGSNPCAGGAECVIFGHIDSRTSAFVPLPADGAPISRREGGLAAHGAWETREMRPGADLGFARALVSAKPEQDYCRTTGRLLLLSHNWSGKLQINDIGRKYSVDLYSETTRLVLLDVVNEIMLDVTNLARVEHGGLKLPPLTTDVIVNHVVKSGACFRFLDPDADFDAGPMRRAIEFVRRRPDGSWKLRMLSMLLPAFDAARVVAAPSAPPPPLSRDFVDASRLRDEVRLLAAAVDGLARRAIAEA